MTIARDDEDGDARRQRHEPRLCRGTSRGSTNGGGGSAATQLVCWWRRPPDRARPSSGRLADVSATSGSRRRSRVSAGASPSRAMPTRRNRRSGTWPQRGRRRSRRRVSRWSAARASGRDRGSRSVRRSRSGMAAERELIDVVLTDRWPAWRVREALASHIPPGWRLIDVFDVWLGGPPLAGRVAAADYRIELEGAPDRAALDRCGHGTVIRRSVAARAGRRAAGRCSTTCDRSWSTCESRLDRRRWSSCGRDSTRSWAPAARKRSSAPCPTDSVRR